MAKTIVIAFEGIDGSGKTVQMQRLARRLSDRGMRVATRAFPAYDSFFGKEIGYLLSGAEGVTADQVDHKSMALWFALDRFEAMRDYVDGEADVLLINRYVRFGELWIGGWYDPKIVREPEMLDDFEQLDGVKVLLCHKPEKYMKLMRRRKLDLVVAGHAHGGQIRLGPIGVYSPGQGLFPRYTKGLIDGRMIVSAGAGNPAGMPRWGNPCEVLMITLD